MKVQLRSPSPQPPLIFNGKRRFFSRVIYDHNMLYSFLNRVLRELSIKAQVTIGVPRVQHEDAQKVVHETSNRAGWTLVIREGGGAFSC